MAQVGPQGQCLFQYSVYNACAAGVDHLVVVVAEGQDTRVIRARCDAVSPGIAIDFVEQNLSAGLESDYGEFDSVLSARQKPWGTAHAVLCCADVVQNPFVVVNADDYYGATNFAHLAEYLLKHQPPPGATVSDAVIPGFLLEKTLSANGGVNRGVLSVDDQGFLVSVYEALNIRREAQGIKSDLPDDYRGLPPTADSLVSMNMWGFQPQIFESLKPGFIEFVREMSATSNHSGEFFIPLIVDQAISSGRLRVKVIATDEQWQGVTFKEDLEGVRNYMKGLADAVHPEPASPLS